jgi:hypothetical protein
MKMAVFWDVSPCSLANIGDVSEVRTAFITRMMMEAVSISETSASIYQTTQLNLPEDRHL